MREFIKIVEGLIKIDDLFEMALPTQAIKSLKYYHGTANELSAKKIMKDGIQPPDLVVYGKKQNGHLTPVAGKVYITSDIAYAAIYAAGASVLGKFPRKYKGNEKRFSMIISDDPKSRFYGRYGYVFVIDGEQLKDIQPDEDYVGEFLDRVLSGLQKNDSLEMQVMGNQLLYMAKQYLSDSTLKRVKDGEYAYYAKAGKVLLKRMPDRMKQQMVEMGFHCAHTGPLFPNEIWKLDKTKVGWIKEDGSNFFEIAKRIR